MSLCQISLNGIIVVLGCTALNQRIGVRLTHMEILYCYSVYHCPQDHVWYYFKARPGTPNLVKCLTRSKKGY